MNNLTIWLCVTLGGAIGTGARFGAVLALRNLLAFPLATLFVNAVGGLAMGAMTGYALSREAFPDALRLGLTTGILGGFTTFSAFSIETVLLWREAPVLAVANVLANLVLGIGACALGYWLVRSGAV